jgi:hypothetical protein
MRNTPGPTLASTIIVSKLEPIIVELFEAFAYAEDTASDRWDFAVAIGRLKERGANESDLRWLVRKGYVAHAREVTVDGDDGREFRSTGNLTFSEQTCFVLTDDGVAHARKCFANDKSLAAPVNGQSAGSDRKSRNAVPEWDVNVRELRIDGCVVKRFKWQALNQEAVLNAFQEEDWPRRIDDPLPPHADQDSKRRLADTIKCLNAKQKNHLLRFHGDGTGEGITWEYVSAGTDRRGKS